ncbi:GNAT family N-acetyltransferase [Ruegeria sp. 2205SS24-7]|uniref:GNAT family N-acetyltransferase n=1 Tax=Ruegeria discodermiae TaxID=3064389 RepID=UPI0027403754|nr:GNAT family N-acetyltransferase [Ruegeria sp. 2205SS24-7]MDP5218200.1 GNAT family N-acetyltransferase [Ruegeria sp. 2205SS24-7]
MTAAPIISTSRLTLRAPTPDDLGAYLAFYSAPNELSGGYRGRRDKDEVTTILKRNIEHWETKGFGIWLLRRVGEQEVLGACGLVHPDDWPRHELTWWLMPEARGKGYATEASRAVIAWAYDEQGWPAVETHMRDENLPARRLAARLGGRKIARDTFPDGVTRDVFELPHAGAA